MEEYNNKNTYKKTNVNSFYKILDIFSCPFKFK